MKNTAALIITNVSTEYCKTLKDSDLISLDDFVDFRDQIYRAYIINDCEELISLAQQLQNNLDAMIKELQKT